MQPSLVYIKRDMVQKSFSCHPHLKKLNSFETFCKEYNKLAILSVFLNVTK